MTRPIAAPKRLSRLPEAEDKLGLGRMFRAAGELPDEELPTLRWRVRTSQRLRVLRPRLVLRTAVVVGVVFCVGGVVGAVVAPMWAPKPSPGTSPSGAAPPRAHKPRPLPAPVAPATPAPEPASEPAVVAPTAATPEPRPTPTRPRAPVRVAMVTEPVAAPVTAAPQVAPPSPAPPPAPEAPSAIAVEQALVGQAMRTLRESHDAQAALTLLAQHADRFPGGALAPEATLLRIEALLALGRRNEALSVLDRTALAALPNRDEQRVVRGELRAAAGRWREAKRDFDDVLREGGLPAADPRARAIQERALWGRASARSRLGDATGARGDIGLYLQFFPAGEFAGQAHSLLEGAP
jgi:hypothetical protein